jgi:hypothetical protein
MSKWNTIHHMHSEIDAWEKCLQRIILLYCNPFRAIVFSEVTLGYCVGLSCKSQTLISMQCPFVDLG